MTSKERVDLALNHKEADRIPIDFGGHLITSIHMDAYRPLLQYMGMPDKPLEIERYRPEDGCDR